MTGWMAGKKGLVVGIANERSFAWFIAQSILREGGECLFTHLPGDKMARRCGKAIESLGVEDPWMMAMDASDDASMDEVFAKIEADPPKGTALCGNQTVS